MSEVERVAVDGLRDDATDRERLAYHEARIERALALPKERQAGTKRTDQRPHVIYTCRDSNGAVLYVGISLTALSRFAGHAQGSLWFKSVAQIDLEHVPNRDVALKRELELIALLSPVHNKAGVPA